jgi:TonB family protein
MRTNPLATALASTALLILVVGAARPSADQEALQKVRALYAAAAYEDALAAVAAVPGDTRAPELDQYRVFCLIALGQKEQAYGAIETLLTQDPLYQPDPTETSPRVIEQFNEVRGRVLPGLTKRLYLDAKTALERRNRQDAITGFETLLRVIDSADATDSTLDDMKVLASGFLDLSRALPEAPKPDPTPAAATDGKTSATAATPAAATWTRPVAVKQEMPRWNAPDALSRRSEFNGVLRVRVAPDGKVQSAEMVRRVHPMYDALLVAAAQNWMYEPARQDGKPVASEVLVEVRLRPQE